MSGCLSTEGQVEEWRVTANGVSLWGDDVLELVVMVA